LKKGRFVEKLVELDLSSNAIGYGLAIVIDAFPQLNILKLSGCRFSRDDAAKFLEKKNNLEILIMSKNINDLRQYLVRIGPPPTTWSVLQVSQYAEFALPES
jgi:hypothetical protein